MKELTITPRNDYGYVVELDGKDIADSISSMGISLDAKGMFAHVNVSLTAGLKIELHKMPAEVAISAMDHELLVSLGWTPPS